MPGPKRDHIASRIREPKQRQHCIVSVEIPPTLGREAAAKARYPVNQPDFA